MSVKSEWYFTCYYNGGSSGPFIANTKAKIFFDVWIFFCDLFRWFFDFFAFAFAFVRCERALTVRDTFVARPLTARTFQNEASWAWRRRRNDRTRVPCATRRRTMRTSSSRAECGPAASATASSDAGPSTPLPVRLNSGGKHYTKRPRLQLCRWYLLSTCVVVSLSGFPLGLETWEGIFQSGKSQGIWTDWKSRGKSHKILENREFQTNVILF